MCVYRYIHTHVFIYRSTEKSTKYQLHVTVDLPLDSKVKKYTKDIHFKNHWKIFKDVKKVSGITQCHFNFNFVKFLC